MRIKMYLISVVFIIGCADPSTAPCVGFNQEPYINVVGDHEDTFGIYYLNDQSLGDTLFTTDGMLQLPVDPQSQEMYYEVIADSALGIFRVNYDLQPQYCESADELVLMFNEMKFDTSSTFLKLSTSDGKISQDIDTSLQYSGFFNQPKSNHHLIIHF